MVLSSTGFDSLANRVDRACFCTVSQEENFGLVHRLTGEVIGIGIFDTLEETGSDLITQTAPVTLLRHVELG